MFNSNNIPFDSVMLFNEVQLKPGLTVDDVELEIAYDLLWQGGPE